MIGRKEEIKRLKAAYASPYSEFVSVYGRRRVGKTFLVNEVFEYDFTSSSSGNSLRTHPSQNCVSSASLSETDILWMKSSVDSAALDSAKFAPIDEPARPS